MLVLGIQAMNLSGPVESLRFWPKQMNRVTSYKIVCALGENSNQPLLSLYYLSEDSLDLWQPTESSGKTDQMCRLIWIFTGCTCSPVGNPVPWLIYLSDIPISFYVFNSCNVCLYAYCAKHQTQLHAHFEQIPVSKLPLTTWTPILESGTLPFKGNLHVINA